MFRSFVISGMEVAAGVELDRSAKSGLRQETNAYAGPPSNKNPKALGSKAVANGRTVDLHQK
jgi:hypothetical protein